MAEPHPQIRAAVCLSAETPASASSKPAISETTRRTVGSRNGSMIKSNKPSAALTLTDSPHTIADNMSATVTATATASAGDADADADDACETQSQLNDADVNRCVALLRTAYAEHNLNLIDTIVADMVAKSQVAGLNKLHTVAGYGLHELVEQYLRDERMDANCQCSFNDLTEITPLHFCAGIGPDAIAPHRDACIRLLVRHGADINHVTSRLDTALHWATKLADVRVCEQLVQCGIDVNRLNVDNCNSAHGAAFYKHVDILEMLIDNGTDVRVRDISGKNILHLLCKDSLDSVVSLSDGDGSGGGSGGGGSSSSSSCPAMADETTAVAVRSADETKVKLLKLVKRLLDEFGLSADENDYAEFTPLMYACEHQSMELIGTLCAHGANIHVINSDGVTCLLLAIVNSCPLVVRYLLDQGFDIKNVHAHTSYVTDAAYLNDVDILAMLIEAGADVNETKQDENGVILNPLWAACERTNLSVVELLLKHGARTIIRPDLQMTALHCAAMAQYESLPIVKLLVECQCPLNMKSAQAGETPLFLAINSGFADVVEYLLGLGVDPNEANPTARTCFQQAVFRGHKDILQQLVNAGYTLTDDDCVDLALFVMDLYQDGDLDMLNFLLARRLVDKAKVLECIQKVHSWQRASKSPSNIEDGDDDDDDDDDTIDAETAAPRVSDTAAALTSQSTRLIQDVGATLVAPLAELKLEDELDYPRTVEQLDAFLSRKANAAGQLDMSHSSEENDDEIK